MLQQYQVTVQLISMKLLYQLLHCYSEDVTVTLLLWRWDHLYL